MKPHRHVQRMVWSAVVLLVLIGVAIVVRRTAQLVPLLINGYQPPAAVSDPAAVRLWRREWMIRAFAIGLAVATIRPIIGIFFATRVFSGLTPAEFFGTGFWI